MSSKPAQPTSSIINNIDISNTDTATHVYIKSANPQSLCPRFEGPYPITSRPSRTQVEIQVGSFADGAPRLLTVHWSLCKVAHMREGAEAASRAPRGRPPAAPPSSPDAKRELSSNPSKTTDTGSVSEKPDQPVEPTTFADNHQNNRPVRSTRNQSPRYVDFLALAA